MTTSELWQAVLGELELTISKPNFTTWFRNTHIISFDDTHIIIGVPNAFTQSWLEKKYHQMIFKALNNLTNRGAKTVTYKVEPRSTALQLEINKSNTIPRLLNLEGVRPKEEPWPQVDKYGLNPRYTFENFVVGRGNELAHAAAQAVAAKPGASYNPLFIYGGIGLGKTHLLQGIGHECLKINKNCKVLYITCEKFINDFINLVRTSRAKEFKDHYRNVDVLLIDDIQFIGGKESTQEELFHTFNALYHENKQMVFSSDRPPKGITVEDRLRSRFQWGMTVDIGNPDLETRMAILETKCKEKGVNLDKDVIGHIATVIQSNVRELEGALNKIIAYCQFKNIPVTLPTTKTVLQSLESGAARKNVTPKHVLGIVANYFDLRLEDLLGISREKRLAFPRQIAMFLLREELKSSYPSIGSELGGRDHTTAMHAYAKIKLGVDIDAKLKQDIENIKQKMYNGN